MNTVTTASIMKTSEFIRNAVDAHLSADGIDHPVQEQDSFICIALLHYKHSLGVYAGQCEAYDKARPMIEQELQEYQKLHSSTTHYHTIGNILKWEWEGEELQAFRFMYAEMLACYFESIGD